MSKTKLPAAIYSKSNSVEKIMYIIFQEILPFKLFALHLGILLNDVNELG
jgi:hypothetical protein